MIRLSEILILLVFIIIALTAYGLKERS